VTLRVKLTRPTFGGNAEYVHIGSSRYGLPPGSRTKRIERRGRSMVYALLSDGELAAFVEDGQVEIPAYLAPRIRARYFPEASP
jgi:hypothetical protein